jgi:hypothetical protein
METGRAGEENVGTKEETPKAVSNDIDMAGVDDPKHQMFKKKKRIVFASGLAGFFIALFWILRMAIPFLSWPRALVLASQISVSAMLIPWGGASGVSSSAVLWVFLFLALSNAAVYGLIALIILVLSEKVRAILRG